MNMTTATIPTSLGDLHGDIVDLRDMADILEALREIAAEHDQGEHSDDTETDECPRWDGDSNQILDALEELEGQMFEPSLRQFAENEPTMIADSYFVQYAEDFADDIGAINRDATWPVCHIDWEAAADDLKQDFMRVEFDGTVYWVRSY